LHQGSGWRKNKKARVTSRKLRSTDTFDFFVHWLHAFISLFSSIFFSHCVLFLISRFVFLSSSNLFLFGCFLFYCSFLFLLSFFILFFRDESHLPRFRLSKHCYRSRMHSQSGGKTNKNKHTHNNHNKKKKKKHKHKRESQRE